MKQNSPSRIWVRAQDNDKNEIIVNDNTILKEIKPTFGRQQKQYTSVSVNYINNEAQLHDRANVVFIISSIEQGGKILRLRKASLQDSTDDVPIIFFGS